MGRLTPEMLNAINELYPKYKNYKKVGEELGIDWRAVKKHIYDGEEGRLPLEQQLYHFA